MLHVSPRIYSENLHTCEATPRRRLHGCEYVNGPFGLRYWPLSVALATVRPSQFKYVRDLVNASAVIPNARLPERPELVADGLQTWANTRHRTHQRENGRWGARMQAVQRAFSQAVADHLTTPIFAQQNEYLRRIILLDSTVIKHVFADHPLPSDFNSFAVNFALTNATLTANRPHQNIYKELHP